MRIFLSVVILLISSGCAAVGKDRASLSQGGTGPYRVAAWDALKIKDYDKAHEAADKCVELLEEEARPVNETCLVHGADCESVNIVGECLAVKVLAYRDQMDWPNVQNVCREILEYYSNSMVLDRKSWAWSPRELCEDILGRID